MAPLQKQGRPGNTNVNPRTKELLIFAVLFLTGLIVLPLCIYVVGISVIGEYSPDAGLSGLLLAIWGDLARFRIAAWLLVLSPWVVIQLARLAVRLWRGTSGSPEAANT